MSNYDHSDFFRETTENDEDPEGPHKTSFELYLETLNDGQRAALDDFYQTYCNPEPGKEIIHPDGRQFDRYSSMFGRTEHNIFFALNVIGTFPSSPKEYSLQVLQKKGDEMLCEEYEVVDVKHVQRPEDYAVDRLVYAKGSKKIAIELGRRVYWIENTIIENQEIPLPFPTGRFHLPVANPA